LQRLGWRGYWRPELHANPVRKSDSNANSNGDSNSYRHSYGYCDSNSNSNSYRNAYGNSNSPAKDYTDAKTSSHAAAETVVSLETVLEGKLTASPTAGF
jgi:hypothetical protein